MAKKKSRSKSADPSFEQSLESLQQIVDLLEEGNLTLNDSLEKYEHGIQHLTSCYQLLQQAQKKIEVLVKLDEHGNLQTSDFDGTATQFESGEDDDSDEIEPIDESDRLF